MRAWRRHLFWHHPDPAAPLHLATRQTPQTAGGSEFVPGELDAVGELEEGGEFDPDDLEEEGEAPVVEESAGALGDGAPHLAAFVLGPAEPRGAAGRN